MEINIWGWVAGTRSSWHGHGTSSGDFGHMQLRHYSRTVQTHWNLRTPGRKYSSPWCRGGEFRYTKCWRNKSRVAVFQGYVVIEPDDVSRAFDPSTNSANFVISMGMPGFSFGLAVNGTWGLEITSSCALVRVSRIGGIRTLNIMTCVCV